MKNERNLLNRKALPCKRQTQNQTRNATQSPELPRKSCFWYRTAAAAAFLLTSLRRFVYSSVFLSCFVERTEAIFPVSAQEPWVGADEVAAHFGIQKPTVYRWVKSEGLPAHRVGRLLRFKLSEVDGWGRARSAHVDRQGEDASR